MKLNILIALIALFFLSYSSLYAANTTRLIPFDQFVNVSMEQNDLVITNYAFGDHLIIFCYDNTLQTFGFITWPFFGFKITKQLPIFLKTRSDVQGELADPIGTIFVRNTTNITRIVSCQFGF